MFPTTQSKRTSDTHEPMKFRVTKVKSKFKSSASKRASGKWKRYQLWILLNLWEKCLKFGENRGNIQDLRFCEERTSRWMSLRLIAVERDVNLPDLAVREDGWEVESISLIVPCEVLLVWNHSTSRQRRVYFSKVGGHQTHHSGELSGTFFQV